MTDAARNLFNKSLVAGELVAIQCCTDNKPANTAPSEGRIWTLTTRVDPRRDTLIADSTPMDSLDFASPVAGLGSKMGIDATNKWPAETERTWGTPITMSEEVKKRIDALWRELGL